MKHEFNTDQLTNARAFVALWAYEQKEVSAISFATLHLDYEELLKAYNFKNRTRVKGLTKQLLEAALEEHLHMVPILKREALALQLKCTGEDLEPLEAWVKAVTGKVGTDDLNVMAHWLWLVKRNAFKLPVVYHIMPIVTSQKQGGGKSTAIKELLKPVEALMLELKVPQVVDERCFTMFTNYLVGFFDEMAGAERVEISDFKRNVTSSSLTYRPMRTNAQVRIQNLCSFIGASNNQLYDIIKDTTGLRRFFPIQALDLTDWNTINSIDYLKLWVGIDENRPRGYYENVKEQVAAKQEGMAMKDEVTLFLEEQNIAPGAEVVNGKKLYKEYLQYTVNAGIRFPVTAQTFYKKLLDAGITGAKKRDANKSLTWYFSIAATHAMVKNQ